MLDKSLMKDIKFLIASRLCLDEESIQVGVSVSTDDGQFGSFEPARNVRILRQFDRMSDEIEAESESRTKSRTRGWSESVTVGTSTSTTTTEDEQHGR